MVLKQPDYTKEFILDTDASQVAIGAVLSQEEMYGQGKVRERPIYFYSRMMTKSEQNYSVTEKEGLAVVLSVAKWRVYLLGSKVRIRVDHQPLLGLFRKLDATGRVARWLVFLSEYDITWEFKKGRRHSNADDMSRAKYAPEVRLAGDGVNDELPSCFMAKTVPWSLKKYQDSDEFGAIVSYLQGKNRGDKKAARQSQRYKLDEGRLWYLDVDLEWKLCVVEQEKNSLLREYHEELGGGHFSRDLLVNRMRKNVFWATMSRDAAEYVKKCWTCQQFAPL